MMRVLVTGAAGFIGASLYMYLVDRGYEVVGVDSYRCPSRLLLSILRERSLEVHRVDVLDRVMLMNVARYTDAIVHLAAFINVDESMSEPYKYINNNVMGTASVLEVGREAGVKKFIYISSAAVYGEPLELPIKESHPTRPSSPYGYSKLMGEYLVRMYAELYGVDSVVLRLFNVYGFGQSGEYAGVIPRFIERVSRGKSPIIYGDGEQTRDFVHVEDVCRAVELALSYNGSYDVFNVGSGRAVSINELAWLVINEFQAEVEPEYEPPRKGDIKHSVADISKASKILGFRPVVCLEDGIRIMIRDYLN